MKYNCTKNDFICLHHKNIINQIEEIECAIKWLPQFIDDGTYKGENTKEEMLEIAKDILESSKEILHSAKIALDQAQRMENKLRWYKEQSIAV